MQTQRDALSHCMRCDHLENDDLAMIALRVGHTRGSPETNERSIDFYLPSFCSTAQAGVLVSFAKD